MVAGGERDGDGYRVSGLAEELGLMAEAGTLVPAIRCVYPGLDGS